MSRFPSVVWLVVLVPPAVADQPAPTREQALAVLRPYDGPTEAGTDRTTLTGKILSGYQGWFTAEGDGAGRGWRHYTKAPKFEPGTCSLDIWPDVSELGADERFATPFRRRDGSVAEVFSSARRATVLRHFAWMKSYGLDGVFVQRFAVETAGPRDLLHINNVLLHCREGANTHGRAYAIMYDLTGLGAGGTQKVMDDWKQLVDRLRLGRDERDPAYLRHRGKPVVAVWGVGFNDKRKYTTAECRTLVEFLKSDPKYGGNTVLIGVPYGWRTLDRDAAPDPALHDVLQLADIVSPWSVGRYDSPDRVAKEAVGRWTADIAWCKSHGLDYLPVAFPGFSWHNMNPGSPSDQIPRRKGRFLWSQFAGMKAAGAQAIYVAMFDEMDEATAIFKCTNDPPVGDSRFLTMEGLSSDHYLWLAGEAARRLRDPAPLPAEPPARPAAPK